MHVDVAGSQGSFVVCFVVILAEYRLQDYVLSVDISPDGAWIVSGSKDRGVQFWDPKSGKAQFMLQGHKNSGTSSFVTCFAVLTALPRSDLGSSSADGRTSRFGFRRLERSHMVVYQDRLAEHRVRRKCSLSGVLQLIMKRNWIFFASAPFVLQLVL